MTIIVDIIVGTIAGIAEDIAAVIAHTNAAVASEHF
jgi:hypothetical protein